MSFAALAGGADCGPVNPLSQLSKLYGQDRGVQQDHFTPQAGPSRGAFRQGGPSAQQPDELNQFLQHQHQAQPFDLSPLNRALSPGAHQPITAAGPPPAWAQAFSSQQQHNQLPLPNSNLESELFRKAFAGSPQLHHQSQSQPQLQSARPEWSSEFTTRHHQQQQQQHDVGPVPNSTMTIENGNRMMYSTGQQRLFGAGFGAPALASSFQPQQLGGGMQNSRLGQDTVVQNNTQDWDTAFKAQESPTSSSSGLIHESYSSLSTDAAQRSESPQLSHDEARDALAETAGRLLDAVRTTERSRASDEQETQPSRNDKFANSSFLELMRKLRDGEVAVEGDKVVEQIEPKFSSVEKGKGRASDSTGWANEFNREEEGRVGGPPTISQFGLTNNGGSLSAVREFANANQAFSQRQAQNANLARGIENDYQTMAHLWDDEDQTRAQREDQAANRSKWQFQGDGGGIREEDERMESDDFTERTREQMRLDTTVPLASSNWEEEFDNDPSMIVGGHATIPALRPSELSAQQKEWNMLQEDWDNFEVSAAGFKPLDSRIGTSNVIGGYAFHQNNPYLNTTRTHALHQPISSGLASNYDTILQKEAMVQQRPHDPQAWLALGIKQQENEREEMAIQALRQALTLDPELGQAHLALAVSYTNENERGMAYQAIDRWVDNLGQSKYRNEVDHYRDLFGPLPEQHHLRHEYLTSLLIRLAQAGPQDGTDVDAEVQIGLGVLFNASEEYEKAGDCFESALSVRPDDPLLFNRLGATFANSGKTELAIQYYLEALDIQPNYVRARFNLAVANMNLHQYEEAVHHLLTSLSIQEADAQLEAGDTGKQANAVTSQTLWDSLNIALLQMHRSDLASLTATRKLDQLMAAFPPTN